MKHCTQKQKVNFLHCKFSTQKHEQITQQKVAQCVLVHTVARKKMTSITTSPLYRKKEFFKERIEQKAIQDSKLVYF